MADAMPSALPAVESSPEQNDRKLIAPLWHTILFILIVAAISFGSFYWTRRYAGGSGGSAELTHKGRVMLYLGTLVQEWILFVYVFLGMRARGRKVREAINARWKSFNEIGRDIGIAAFVWVTLIVINALGSFIFRSHAAAGSKVVFQLVPHAASEIPLWTALAISAGFCEEFIFRGYLQEQFKRLTGSVGAAVGIQAVLFGLGHGYQGWSLMTTIFFLGLAFGIVAAWRKSLAPTMLAHGWTDFASGMGGYLLHVLHKI